MPMLGLLVASIQTSRIPATLLPGGTSTPDELTDFCSFLYGNQTGYTWVCAGATAAEITARAWPLGPGEQADDDQHIHLLVWTKQTGDAFRQGNRPHTGKAFAWPQQAPQMRAYVAHLADEYDDVYIRRYLADSIDGAKRGEAPAQADYIFVEDAPVEPGQLAPAYSGVLTTSSYSQQAVYKLTRSLPWSQLVELAACAGIRLGADNGGKNAAQLTRVPGTRNSKATAGRYRVRWSQTGPAHAPSVLSRAVGMQLGMVAPERAPRLAERVTGLVGHGDEEWRVSAWREALRDASNRVNIQTLLTPDGMPKGLKPGTLTHRILTAARQGHVTYSTIGGTRDGSQERYNIVWGLASIGYNRAELAALSNELAAFGEAEKGSEAIWIDVCRCIWKITIQQGIYKPRRAEPGADAPLRATPRPEVVRRRKGRPESRTAHTDQLAALLAGLEPDSDGWARTTRAALAAQLGKSESMVKIYLADLRHQGRIISRVEPRFLAVRCPNEGDNLIHEVSRCEGANTGDLISRVISPSDAVNQGSVAVVSVHEEHTAPLAPPSEHLAAEAPAAIPHLADDAEISLDLARIAAHRLAVVERGALVGTIRELAAIVGIPVPALPYDIADLRVLAADLLVRAEIAETAETAGASYDPALAGQVDPMKRPLETLAGCYESLSALYAWLEDRDGPRMAESLEVLAPAPAALVRRPPQDSARRSEYYKLLRASEKSPSPRQRAVLRARALSLEEWGPPPPPPLTTLSLFETNWSHSD